MFCLRSWLPLLFIPTNASPLFILSFVILTYILHRPCIYCSALLLILFTSSCQWSDRCFFDIRGDWFSPRFTSNYNDGFFFATNTSSLSSIAMSNNTGNITFNDDIHPYNNESLSNFIKETINTTATALAGAAIEEAKRKVSSVLANDSSIGDIRQHQQAEVWTGIGLEWLRSLMGRREWTIPCVDVKIRL